MACYNDDAGDALMADLGVTADDIAAWLALNGE